MKIRRGFVSNSSSSSYILAYQKAKFVQCGCCGFTPTSPLEKFNGYGYGDSEVLWDDAAERLVELRQDARRLLDEIAELCKQDPRKIIRDYGNYTWTVHDRIQSLQEDLDFVEREIGIIQGFVDAGWTVIGVEVDHHTNDAEYIFEMRDQGFLVVVQGD